MKISYNWLKEYIDINLDPQTVARYLTDTGLEVEGIEQIESVKGGLKGIVIGEVLAKEKHPNADRLSITTVNIGKKETIKIVCGAPNVEVGQKVPVATIGTILFSNNESFKIKKGKIRGEVSEGMICAENEIGLGNSHEGIMVLDSKAKVGQLASEYFNIETDIVFEIGLTPNRSDAMSHIGVARDLAAVLNHNNIKCQLNFADISAFKEGSEKPISIEVKDEKSCPRYAGISIKNVKVKASPNWLQKRLQSIGLTPINNVVDITNYVLHEIGQPLHAFDAKKIENDTIIVQQLKDKTKFTTLDDEVRELSSDDLIICDGKNKPMCIAGVFGGKNSAVEKNTTEVFLESAYFSPKTIRKTAKRHNLNTDASFRFERSVDPNLVVYALKRAALLIKDICKGHISSSIIDLYPNEIKYTNIELSIDKVNKLIGEKIKIDIIKSILKSLDIKLNKEDKNKLYLSVPPYRVDVTRQEDIIEEILRIYGYNNIHIPSQLKSSIIYSNKFDEDYIQNIISELLSNNGFNECINNSLSKSSYSDLITEIKLDEQVKLLNPLSQDLDGMRQSLLFSGLESIAYNLNRKNYNLNFYEFGKTYQIIKNQYIEKKKLVLLSCGNEKSECWNEKNIKKDFFWIKQKVEHILNRLGLNDLKGKNIDLSYLFNTYSFNFKKNRIADFGFVNKSILKVFGIKTDVLYAELDWDFMIKNIKSKTKYSEVNKFPIVRRDLALLIDKDIEFSKLKSIAKQTEKKLLKSVNLFDVYEGDKIPKNKKSYALSFTLEDKENTLTDLQIDYVMQKLIDAYKQKIGAELRK